MSEKVDVQAALRDAIQTEKDAMDYYLYASEKMNDDKARDAFALLAREERQHAKMFYKVYKGGDLPPFDEYMQLPPKTDSSWWTALQEALLGDFDERKALELALDQEEALEKELREMAAKIDDAEICAIYEANANSTHHHAEVIEDEYKAMLGMSS
ncbi:MAG: rubrerythrin [Desulfuromonas sp.]|nr:MAG: rubrerythrin [Desulfuromonas sp.]